MKKILREPLLHFLLLGGAIFAAYDLMPKRTRVEPGKIVITREQIAAMAEGFTRTWRRPPLAEELEGLVRDRVQEEVYCREAMALGLDKDDTVIRRRLRQKVEFVSDDIAAQAEPTDADLNAYLQAHPETFRVEQRITFRQVYLNPEKHGESLAKDAAELLEHLNQAGIKDDGAAAGDSSLLERDFTDVPTGEVAKQFGETFAAKLGGLAPGRWQGPVESGYGVHLVWVNEHTEGRLPALAEVSAAVAREWANARRMEANGKFYAELLRQYAVTIEKPHMAQAK